MMKLEDKEIFKKRLNKKLVTIVSKIMENWKPHYKKDEDWWFGNSQQFESILDWKNQLDEVLIYLVFYGKGAYLKWNILEVKLFYHPDPKFCKKISPLLAEVITKTYLNKVTKRDRQNHKILNLKKGFWPWPNHEFYYLTIIEIFVLGNELSNFKKLSLQILNWLKNLKFINEYNAVFLRIWEVDWKLVKNEFLEILNGDDESIIIYACNSFNTIYGKNEYSKLLSQLNSENRKRIQKLEYEINDYESLKVKLDRRLLFQISGAYVGSYSYLHDEHYTQNYSHYLKCILDSEEKVFQTEIYLLYYGKQEFIGNFIGDMVRFPSPTKEFCLKYTAYIIKALDRDFEKYKNFFHYIVSIFQKTNSFEKNILLVLKMFYYSKNTNKKIYESIFLDILYFDWKLVKNELQEFIETGEEDLVIRIAANYLWDKYGDRNYKKIKNQLELKEKERLDSLHEKIIIEYKKYRLF